MSTDSRERLSLNTVTLKRLSLLEVIDQTVAAGLTSVGPWRAQVAELGTARAAAAIRDAGLRVSSLCRGGFLTAEGDAAARSAVDDNRAALEMAATLGTRELVVVVGGLIAGRDLVGARARVAERLDALALEAKAHGVRLALEPLHPMYCADRAVLSTLGQALDLAEQFPAEDVGVVVDTFHVWWDPQLFAQIRRAGHGHRIAAYQICDFLLPIAADALLSRGIPGDGCIDFPSITHAITEAGYRGDVEVEIFNEAVWNAPASQVLSSVVDRYRELVVPYLND